MAAEEHKQYDPVDYAGNAKRIALGALILILIQTFISLGTFAVKGLTEDLLITILMAGFASALFYAYRLASNGRPVASSSIVIPSAIVVHACAQMLMQDTTQEWIQKGVLICLLCAAILTFPPRHLLTACLVIIATHLAIAFLDAWVPSIDAGYRLSMRFVSYAVLGSMVLVLGIRVIKRFRDLPLLSKLVACMVAIVLVPTMAISIAYSSWLSRQIVFQETRHLETIMERFDGRIGGYVEEIAELARHAAVDNELLDFYAEKRRSAFEMPRELISLVRTDDRHIESIFLLDADGSFITGAGAVIGENTAKMLKDHIADHGAEPFWLPHTASLNHRGALRAEPIFDEDGSSLGWLTFCLSDTLVREEIEWLSETWGASDTEFLVADKDGSVIFASPRFEDAPDTILGIRAALENPGTIPSAEQITRDRHMARATVVPVWEWRALIAKPAGAFLEPVFRQVGTANFATTAVMLFALGIAFILARTINLPIWALEKTARAWRAGNLSERADASRTDDLGRLARTFNELTAQLQGSLSGLRGQIDELATAHEEVRRQETHLRELYESAPIGMSTVGIDTVLTNVNPALCEWLGYNPDELIGQPVAKLAGEEHHEELIEAGKSLVTGKVSQISLRVRTNHKDGSDIYGLVTVSVVRDRDGNPDYFLAQVVDVTKDVEHEREIAERDAELRRRQRERERIIDLAPIPVVLIQHDDDKVMEANEAFAKMSGYTQQELVDFEVDSFAYDDEAKKQATAAGERLAAGESDIERYEYLGKTKSGDVIEILIVQTLVRDGEGQPLYFIVQGLDMTSERRQQRILAESQSERKAVFDHAPYGMAILDADESFYIDVNEAYCESTGYSREELIGKRVAELTDEENWNICYQAGHRLFHHLSTFESFHQEINHKSGETRQLSVALSLINDEHGRPKHFVSQSVDITEELIRQQQTKESEERLRLIADNTSDMIWLLDGEGRFIYVTPSCRVFHGVEASALVGEMAVDWIHPEDRDLIVNAEGDFLDDGPTKIRRYRCVNKNGEFVAAEFKATVIRNPDTGRTEKIIGSSRDIRERLASEAERHELERQIQHSQKLESLGLMAGGIAHDFNNLLVAILGHANIAQLEVGAESEIGDHLRNIETASLRASELTKQLLAYSGRGKLTSEFIDLSALVKDMVSLLEVSVSKHVTMDYDLAEGDVGVQGDPGQLQQIVLNLITNASEAIGDNPGEITISTRVRHVREDELLRMQFGDGCLPGRYATLVVRDSGAGMDSDTLDRIFDPFFTTKQTGRGLGLAAISGIVRSHHGAVSVESIDGEGTVFTILIPVAQRTEPATEVLPEPTAAQEGAAPAVVLVVDDEPLVRDTAKIVLERSGYMVLTAENGKIAVERFAEDPQRVDAVVLDLTMPVMNGADAYEAMKAIDANVRVLITSGFDESDAGPKFAALPPFGFLQKPYRPADLAAMVGRMVES